MLNNRKKGLSGYEVLRVLVMFDLLVVEKSDRKAATKFRMFLLDKGFSMAQYSVYYRLVSGKDSGPTLEKQIREHLPEYGSVHIVSITDKRYENIKVFMGKQRESHEKSEQLLLF